ncbi:MAG: DUF3237 domain-containing protein [Acidobacteriia bacterium]|nr:DUF3237 domain-containing protein [Methyloceanibacter sp.]MCL6490525.1 DUF3237 domain-containing protein [Terriglobia bacterium]
MSEVATEFLFEMRLNVIAPVDVGTVGGNVRRFAAVTDGSFEGPKLRGVVLPGGSDALVIHPNGRTLLDVRLALQTHDGAAIFLQYRGVRSGPEAVLQRLARGETVDPSDYYFRTILLFETGDARYAWLNDLVGVGLGRREPNGPIYRVFALR